MIDVCHSMSTGSTNYCFNPVIPASVRTQTHDVPTTITPSMPIDVNSAVHYQETEQWDNKDNNSMRHSYVYPTYGFKTAAMLLPWTP